MFSTAHPSVVPQNYKISCSWRSASDRNFSQINYTNQTLRRSCVFAGHKEFREGRTLEEGTEWRHWKMRFKSQLARLWQQFSAISRNFAYYKLLEKIKAAYWLKNGGQKNSRWHYWSFFHTAARHSLYSPNMSPCKLSFV